MSEAAAKREIVASLADGHHMLAASKAAKVCFVTIVRWVSEDREFADQVAAARAAVWARLKDDLKSI